MHCLLDKQCETIAFCCWSKCLESSELFSKKKLKYNFEWEFCICTSLYLIVLTRIFLLRIFWNVWSFFSSGSQHFSRLKNSKNRVFIFAHVPEHSKHFKPPPPKKKECNKSVHEEGRGGGRVGLGGCAYSQLGQHPREPLGLFARWTMHCICRYCRPSAWSQQS